MKTILPRLGTVRSLVGALFIVGVLSSPAHALSGTLFEGADGNLLVDAQPDWESFVGDSLKIGNDLPSGQDDDSLQGKEDDSDLEITYGSIPNNKSDLTRFYVVHERVPAGGDATGDFLYVAWMRTNTLGSANMDFEFNQSSATAANGVTPIRTPGDILITFSFSGGGNKVELGLSRWTDTGDCEAANSAPCWGPIVPLTGIAEGAVNGAATLDPITGATLAEATFGEAMIDLTAAGVFDTEACVSFGRGYVKSRSSSSFTSSMKDFIRPIQLSVTNCATVNVVKNAVPDDVQSFDFTTSGEPSTFRLDDDGDDSNALSSRWTLEDRFASGQGLTVMEEPTTGWDLTDVSCSGPASPDLDAQGRPTGTVQMSPAINDDIECTFTNTKRGRILIDQVTLPSGDSQQFAFSLSGGPDTVAQAFGLRDLDTPYDSAAVRPGTYSVIQANPGVAWDLTASSCDDGSPVNAVDLAPGETVTCTFVNTKRGRILIDQVTVPADDPQQFDFSLTGGPDAVDQSFGLRDADTPHDSNVVRFGTYSVSQTDPGDAWDLTGSSCDDGSSVNAVDLAPGETVTCTFVNTKRATLTVIQNAVPDDTKSFAFTLIAESTSMNFQLVDDGGVETSTASRLFMLIPGACSVTQGDPGPQWDLTGLTCTDTDGSQIGSISMTDRSAAVDLAPGESATCVFTNLKRGRMIVEKFVVNQIAANGVDPRNWPFSFSADWEASFELRHGETRESDWLLSGTSYKVSETLPPGWIGSSSCAVDGVTVDSGGTSIQPDVGPGQTVHCTFVNEMRLHPGSGGFWRNWTNHYSADEFLEIIVEALADSPIYAGLFDANGQPVPDIIDRINEFFDNGGGSEEQKALRELTSLYFNLAVSKSEDPEIRALQNNDDVCLTCAIDVSGISGAEALLMEWARCPVFGMFTVGDVIEAAEATWTGLMPGTWEFGELPASDVSILTSLAGGINPGPILIAVPTSDGSPECWKLDVPDIVVWYLDADGDGYGLAAGRVELCDHDPQPVGFVADSTDCDDIDGSTYPGATEVCDGSNNDCLSAGWPALPPMESDVDGDGLSACAGDCDGNDAAVYPGAPEICDGRANDCSSPSWPLAPDGDRDDDLDGFTECAGDCDDLADHTYPSAPEICDGLNNDCSDPLWPAAPASEADDDLDGFSVCAGDCSDLDSTRYPGAAEQCNGLDDDCNGEIDNDGNGLDGDGDGFPGACDSCPVDYDPSGSDVDHDGYGDPCDNCPADSNPSQGDFDLDGEGDRCDEDDGIAVLYAVSQHEWGWHDEPQPDVWNLYRGDLDLLKASGVYTQLPGSNPLAEAACGMTATTWWDMTIPPSGSCAFYLIAGAPDGGQDDLGQNSDGASRPNDSPCLPPIRPLGDN